MCSVVGYVGTTPSRQMVLEALARLEYRGYDSAGFACVDTASKCILYAKAAGPLEGLKEKLTLSPIDGLVSVGHTRWSTHGLSTEQNAHPHFDCKKKLAVVHNGIIENHAALREKLEQEGHGFFSETDTEVIAHLLEDASVISTNPLDLLKTTVASLEGAYAFVAIADLYPDTLLLARKGSPLCIGLGAQECFVASDVLAFAGKTDRVIFMPEHTLAIVTKEGAQLYDFAGNRLAIPAQVIDAQWVLSSKDGHEHYMLKEIYEQRGAIQRSVTWYRSLQEQRWEHLGISVSCIEQLEEIVFLACGTSWHAGKMGEFFFEDIAGIPATAQLASEFRYKTYIPKKNRLYIAISQSGETADTLEAIKLVKEHGQATLVITNVASSSLVRECDGFLLTHAGPEMAVASTKAFSAQLAALYWLAAAVAYQRNTITSQEFEKKQDDILVAAQLLETGLDRYASAIMDTYAPHYAEFNTMIFLGRSLAYPFALEAALKLKEIAYVFCQAYPAGELKHGALALIDPQTPVVVFSHPDPVLYQKTLSNVQEVKARGGRVLAFVFTGQQELKNLADDVFEFLPCGNHLSFLAMTGVMQLFMYHCARLRGCAIDRPRNLAKSVTVE